MVFKYTVAVYLVVLFELYNIYDRDNLKIVADVNWKTNNIIIINSVILFNTNIHSYRTQEHANQVIQKSTRA